MTRKIPEGYVAIPFIAGQSDKVEQSVDPAMPKDIVTLRLNLRFAQRLQQATGDVPYLLGNAASVFQMLWKLTSAGFTPEENELCGLYELCSRGLSAAAEKEGEEINRLAVTLRSVLALHTDKEV